MSNVRRKSSAAKVGMNRREALQIAAMGMGGLVLSGVDQSVLGALGRSTERSVILLMMVGGPSQLETWDPKPDAPAEIRGPHRSIATRIPGVRINEHLPRLAQRMDRLALIRSVHHEAAPIHETGQQLLQTGQLSTDGVEHPSLGAISSRLQGCRGPLPASVVLPAPIGNTGVLIPHGQSAGWLGEEHRPFTLTNDRGSIGSDPIATHARAQQFANDASADFRARRRNGQKNPFDLGLEPEGVRDAYGRHTFGQSCLMARRLVEAGVRVVTVNMFETVFNRVTWDCHGARPFSTLDDYANEVLPMFDQAFSALLDDLQRSGLIDTTMVLAAGEFGRSPRLNATGGRDHWPDVWSVAIAGGGIRGGQVIGASDASASTPVDRPVTPKDLFATLLLGLDLDPASYLTRKDGEQVPIVEEAAPITELFA
jgi:uncharacterized protein (DUF1501 family)